MVKTKIQEFRKNAKMSQRDLAKMMDLSQGQIWRIESGESLPNSKQIMKLCKIFNCTPNDLFGIKDIYDKVFQEWED